MFRRQRTSRHFLRHLLPRDGLSHAQRSRLDTVLKENNTKRMRDLAAELAEALVAGGRFERLGDDHYLDPVTGRHIRLLSTGGRAEEAAAGLAAAPAREATEPATRSFIAETGLGRQVTAILRAVQLEGRDPGLVQGLKRLLALLDEWFPGSRSVLYRFDDEGREDDEPSIRGLQLDSLADDHPFRRVIDSQRADVLTENDYAPDWFQEERAGDIATWIIKPLAIDGETWGLLELRLEGHPPPERALETLTFLGQALTHQVHNHRVLSEVVYVDWLTQVLNRSFLERQLPLEIERATRNDEPLALIVMDIDDFKRINDSCGHDVGDQVLREFSQVMRNTLRKVDQIFRFGGEEFVILLPRLELASAFRAAERLRRAVERHAFGVNFDGSPIQITASLGGAIFPENALGESALFKAADEACYRAKSLGKNRVVFADADPDLLLDLDD